MSANIKGITAGQVIANPNFRAKKDSTGKWAATQTYSIKRGDYGSVAHLFLKGAVITGIYPEVQTFFDSFIIDDHEYQENAGGIDTVSVSFVGFSEGDEGQTARETIYDYSADMAERPIIEHPKFKALLVPADAAAIVRCYEGTGRCEDLGATDPSIVDNYSGLPITLITDPDSKLWFDLIIRRGVRTYLDPVSEYTETKTDLGGLTQSKVADLGKLDAPPNSPPAPSGKVWFLSGLTETRSTDNPVTYSRKWTVLDDNADTDLIYGP